MKKKKIRTKGSLSQLRSGFTFSIEIGEENDSSKEKQLGVTVRPRSLNPGIAIDSYHGLFGIPKHVGPLQSIRAK